MGLASLAGTWSGKRAGQSFTDKVEQGYLVSIVFSGWCCPIQVHIISNAVLLEQVFFMYVFINHCYIRGVFRPRQTRQLPRAVDLKGQLLSFQSY